MVNPLPSAISTTIAISTTPYAPNSSLLEPLLSVFPATFYRLLLSPPEEPSKSPFTKMRAMKELGDDIVTFFKTHSSPPMAIFADFFLGWTHHLASNLGVPRVTFLPSGAYGISVGNLIWGNELSPEDPEGKNSIVKFYSLPGSPSFPWWQITFLFRGKVTNDGDGIGSPAA